MNNKKCMIPKYYIEKLYFVDFRAHCIFQCNLCQVWTT